MFETTSRYYKLETATLTSPDGRVIAYKRRRFLPPSESMPLFGEMAVTQGDRLDLVTSRTLGNPEQFWRVCDANNAMNPSELIPSPQGSAQAGAMLRIPVPQA